MFYLCISTVTISLSFYHQAVSQQCHKDTSQFSPSRVSIVRNHDRESYCILYRRVKVLQEIVIFQGGDKDEARCKWYSWSANAFPLFVLFDTKMANMCMGHISNTPFGENRTVTIMWCLWGNWRDQFWSLSVQRCSRTQTLEKGFSGSRKNFQSSN